MAVVVDVLEARGAIAQAGELEPPGEAPALALGPLAIDEQADAVEDVELPVRGRVVELLVERAGEGMMAQRSHRRHAPPPPRGFGDGLPAAIQRRDAPARAQGCSVCLGISVRLWSEPVFGFRRN